MIAVEPTGVENVRISYLALLRILTKHTDDNHPLRVGTFDSEVYLEIKSGPYEGYCMYDTETQSAFAFSSKWEAIIQETLSEIEHEKDESRGEDPLFIEM